MDIITAMIAAFFGINALGAKRAVDASKLDEFGMNDVDREYIEHLQKQVAKGEITEEEAMSRLSSSWKGNESTFESAWNDVKTNGSNVGMFGLGSPKLSSLIDSLIAHFTRAELTGAEREMNAFNSGEAQLSRDFTEYMARNKYSMETQSMQDAGVNPAMVYGGGSLVPTASNGATGSNTQSGSGDLVSLLSTLVRLPSELSKLKADASKSEKEGDAALIRASADTRNADSYARLAGVGEQGNELRQKEIDIKRKEVEIKERLADSQISLNDAEINKLAKESLYVEEQTSYIAKYYDIAVKNANSAEKQAVAAIMSARAHIAQAQAYGEQVQAYKRISESQAILNQVLSQKEGIYRDYLPAELSAKIDEMKARGYYFNEAGDLCNKEGKLTDARIIHEYVSIATEVATAVCNVVGTVVTKGLGGTAVGSTKPLMPYTPSSVNNISVSAN